MSDQKFRVLLVEDNPGDARLVQESLADAKGDPFDVETADRLATALRRLSAGGIDAVLLDLALPDSKGQDTFARAKAQAPAVPIIILTGLGDEALALKMVQEGAQDYVAKLDLNGSILSRAIRYAIERERADQQIRKFNEELEERVRARTAELEAANRELEAFSYSVSHDLRSPLMHLSGFANLLAEKYEHQLGAEGKKYLQRIEQAVARMASLIDDLLKLAKVSRQEMKLQEVGLRSLVDEVLKELEADIRKQETDWRIGQLPRVRCDCGSMRQVLANLVSNAIKYTRPRRRAVIEIGQAIVEGIPAFFVRDNGVGFDMKYADKLFAPFQRLHRQEEFEGTGIGLATVQRIIHKHGGHIWAESQPEQGSTFYFTLGAGETKLVESGIERAQETPVVH